jgi:tRNA U34 5-methylaminomethyl-2-thiouridine-forming methyltransferase MnmC
MAEGCEVVLTRSGARAMLDHASGEVMHPIGGPLAEAARLYIGPSRLEQRLSERVSEPLVLLDVGLGAGTLAAAALRVRFGLPAGSRRLELVSFERSLAALELALRPEHESAFGWDGPAGEAARALASEGRYESPVVSWSLRHGDILDQLPRQPAASADLVFWDPFSPDANPELWSLAAFRALRRVCRDGASVHTYSGATRVRSALLLAGFAVGIGDKIADGKHATVAALPAAVLTQPLDRRWLERLSRSSAPFPSDAPADAFEQVRALPQFE